MLHPSLLVFSALLALAAPMQEWLPPSTVKRVSSSVRWLPQQRLAQTARQARTALQHRLQPSSAFLEHTAQQAPQPRPRVELQGHHLEQGCGAQHDMGEPRAVSAQTKPGL